MTNPDIFDRFTDRAKITISIAQDEAQARSHPYIGTEHLLLGLIKESHNQEFPNMATRILSNLGVLPRVSEEIESVIGTQSSSETGLTKETKNVVELAVIEARRLNHHFIGTEHLLLGLRDEDDGLAAKALDRLGVTSEGIRAEIHRILTERTSTVKDDSNQKREERQRITSLFSGWTNFLVDPTIDQTKKEQYLNQLEELLKEAKGEDTPNSDPPTAG